MPASFTFLMKLVFLSQLYRKVYIYFLFHPYSCFLSSWFMRVLWIKIFINSSKMRIFIHKSGSQWCGQFSLLVFGFLRFFFEIILWILWGRYFSFPLRFVTIRGFGSLPSPPRPEAVTSAIWPRKRFLSLWTGINKCRCPFGRKGEARRESIKVGSPLLFALFFQLNLYFFLESRTKISVAAKGSQRIPRVVFAYCPEGFVLQFVLHFPRFARSPGRPGQ